MFLIFINNEFYGNTRSKKVVKSMKNVFPKLHSLHINEYNILPFEYSYMDSDEYQINIYELKDKFGQMHSVISTEYEQKEASKWINNIIINSIMIDNSRSLEIFETIPIYIKRHLANYEPLNLFQIYDDTVDDEYWESNQFDLTYEGFLMYLKRGDLYEYEKDLRMLSEGLPF